MSFSEEKMRNYVARVAAGAGSFCCSPAQAFRGSSLRQKIPTTSLTSGGGDLLIEALCLCFRFCFRHARVHDHPASQTVSARAENKKKNFLGGSYAINRPPTTWVRSRGRPLARARFVAARQNLPSSRNGPLRKNLLEILS